MDRRYAGGECGARRYCSGYGFGIANLVFHTGIEGQDFGGTPAGAVMTVLFQLDRQEYTALDGGPEFKFNKAICCR